MVVSCKCRRLVGLSPCPWIRLGRVLLRFFVFWSVAVGRDFAFWSAAVGPNFAFGSAVVVRDFAFSVFPPSRPATSYHARVALSVDIPNCWYPVDYILNSKSNQSDFNLELGDRACASMLCASLHFVQMDDLKASLRR